MQPVWAPEHHAPAPPPTRRVGRIVGAATGLAVTVGGTAAITYAMTRQANPENHPSSTVTTVTAPAPAPVFSAAERAAAGNRVCQLFDVSTRGLKAMGAARTDSQVNVPLMLRRVDGVVAMQDALGPAVAPDIGSAARTYISATLAFTVAVMGETPTDEATRLNAAANDAIDAMVGVCGLGH